MDATDQLRAEHDGILTMLKVLDVLSKRIASGESVEFSHIDRVIEFLQVFADQCHHGKEEEFLFPALERAGIAREGGPIGVMLGEHDQGRYLIASMKRFLNGVKDGESDAREGFAKAAEGYIHLLRTHIAKENEVLFVMAERSLSPEELEHLYGEFERMEREEIGEGRHEAFHRLMDELGDIYLNV